MKTQNTEVQNFVRDLREGGKNFVNDYVYAPCIMLIYINKKGFRYCHFDENNFDELRIFVDLAFKNGNKNIGFFGGYGSQNTSRLIKYINRKGLNIMGQKDFVDFSPLKEIKVFNNNFYLLGDSEGRKYTFNEFYEILG